MNKLLELSGKNKKLVIGIMSGTSLDGVDLALVEISGSGTETSIVTKGYIEYPFPKGYKEILLDNSAAETSSVEDICRLNFLVPQIYYDGICELLKINGMKFSDIDLIGSHGQTIQHLPEPENMFGYDIRSTLQIGDPSVLAKLTGVITVGDFRTADMAFEGQGAPLVPYFDYVVFRSPNLSRALLNIGGISNFSIIPKNSSIDQLRAFDTGPGNMIIDYLVRRFYNEEFDRDGAYALSGKVNDSVLEYLKKKDTYIERVPPKSTGRELYGVSFIEEMLREFPGVSDNDWIATAAEFTAYAVYKNYEKFIMPFTSIDELIVSGGGAKNNFIMFALKKYFGESVSVYDAERTGISPDAKEAICFAVLANETISGNCANVPSVTGAKNSTILGKICLP